MIAFLLQFESLFDGPTLMILTFVGSLMLGIALVKSCYKTNRGFRSLINEVKIARRKIMQDTHSSDGWSGYGSESGGTHTNDDARSESGTSTYSASDGVFLDDHQSLVEVGNVSGHQFPNLSLAH